MFNVTSMLFNRDHTHGLVGDDKQTFSGIGRSGERHAIVLSGGGIDSFAATVAYTKLYDPFDDEGDTEISLTFLNINYGQASYDAERHMTQKQADYFTSKNYRVNVIEITDPLMEYIRNPLANREQEKETATSRGIDYSKNDDYVPNRNARFLFTAAGLAESIYADTIIIGAVGNVNQDNSYVFLEKAYETIKQSNRDVFPNIFAPFVLLTKSMVALYINEVKLTDKLPYLTTSCFDVNEISETDESRLRKGAKRDIVIVRSTYIFQCGVCRSCVSLKQAFKFAAIPDPYMYNPLPKIDGHEHVSSNVLADADTPRKYKVNGIKTAKLKPLNIEEDDDED